MRVVQLVKLNVITVITHLMSFPLSLFDLWLFGVWVCLRKSKVLERCGLTRAVRAATAAESEEGAVSHLVITA